MLAFVAACGGDAGNATGTPGPVPASGVLSITVAGLPDGSAASISVNGPAGFARTVTGSQTLSGLSAGTYDIAVSDVTVGVDRFAGTSSAPSVTIADGATAAATIGYAIATGTLTISASGLPEGAAAAVAITGPNGFARTASSGSTIGGLAPGTYRVAATAVTVEDATYTPLLPFADVAVTASAAPVPTTFPYQLASGTLIVSIAGLPGGMPASAIVTGPNGFRRTVSSGDRLANLVPGTYTITADPVTVGADAYGIPAPVTVVVLPSVVPLSASVQYALATGRLSVNVTGLPPGSTAGITVTGPNGFSRAVTATQTLVGLAPGQYTVAADGVSATAAAYGASPASQAVSVSASMTPATATVSYAVTTGALAVTVAGLPLGVAAAITVAGPNGYSASIATSTTLVGLAPGSYTLTASSAVAGGNSYAPAPSTRTIAVAASETPAATSFTYALASGGIALTITGLPVNVLASIAITGPGGYSRAVTATTVVQGLTPGTYTVVSHAVQSGGASWAPTPATQSVVVTASTSAVTTTVNYVSATGALAVSVSGLPNGVAANVTVTGPNAFSQGVAASTTLSGLVQGSYTVLASAVSSGGTTYTPSATSQGVSVAGGATSSTSVTYTGSAPPPPPPPTSLNLTIDGMHIQQVVQTYGGTVPIVTGRNGLLRVFVKANGTNAATPAVRVRFYNGATLANTITINAPGGSVPQSVTTGTLSSSWNYLIPSAWLQPGLRILADVDPNNTVVESSESDNSFPLSGTPASIDVRTVPTFNIRMVPVLQSATGLQGGVTTGNAASYLADTRAMFPLDAVDVDVRAPFTTNADTLKSGDANGAWNQILSEVNALRAADGSSRHYYGIVKVNYSSGIAGMGYVPGRASIGWDKLPSGSGVMAHELGHNFGRFHAPSCGAGGADPSYPHAQGRIGSHGYDLATNALKDSTLYDLMGYCNPTWVSGYTFTSILNYRNSSPIQVSALVAGSSARRGLLVWGRVQNGQVILEPTFEVDAPPSLPQRPGPNRLQGFGPLGQLLFDLPFDGEHVADHPDRSAQNFAFVIPFDMMRGQQPTLVRATAGAARAEFRSTTTTTTAADVPVAERIDARAVRLRWSGGNTRGVMVRHPSTGEILAFGRGGEATVYTGETALDVVTSDGVRSERRRIGVGGTPPSRRR